MPEPRTITLTLPWPSEKLNPNRAKSLHWGMKGRAVSMYRDTCCIIALNAKNRGRLAPFAPPVLATVTFYVTDKRRRDIDNLDAMLKPLWDGIVDAGVLADDSAKELRHGESKLVLDRGGEKRVEVTLTEVGG